MRAGDADRQVVADQLRSALEEGRLDLHEYDERLQRAYAAKTYAELDALLTDLPGTIPAERAQVVPFAPAVPASAYPNVTWRWLTDVWDGYFGVVAICAAIWAVTCVMTGDLLYFWPGWVAGPWGAVLVVQTVGGLASGEPQKWAAKKARKAADKAERKARKRADEEREADEDD
ncbi:DUF1707 domain-containing protein [Actinomycetes bacterium KLBMP 9797]